MSFIRTNVLAFFSGVAVVGGYGVYSFKQQTDAAQAQQLAALEALEAATRNLESQLAKVDRIQENVSKLAGTVATHTEALAESDATVTKHVEAVDAKIAELQGQVAHLKSDMLEYVPGIRVSSKIDS